MIISDIYTALQTLEIPAQIGDYQTTSDLPDVYVVIIPLFNQFQTADDVPDFDVQQASIEVYSKGMWRSTVKQICDACISKGLLVHQRRYIGRNEETGYFQYSVTFEQAYDLEEQGD